MSIPKVSEDVCMTVVEEINRRGIPHLMAGLEVITEDQPCLIATLNGFIQRFLVVHGALAAESMMRLLIIQYKLIDAQFEVNELEEQGEL